MARAAVVIAVILVGGRFLLRPLFRAIGGAKTPEVFTTVALLIVAGTALLATVAGLSPSLGAFMAGVLLSESEYRHELQADIEPFEGLLLGFFFISVGMSADLPLARAQPLLLAGHRRAAVRQGGDRVRAGAASPARTRRTRCASPWRCRRPASSASCCSPRPSPSEPLNITDAALATLVTAASMVATPILFAGAEAAMSRLKPRAAAGVRHDRSQPTPVIICGFGRFGQIIGRVLRMHGIEFTALERDPGQVEVVRRFGNKVYFGDPTRAGHAARGGRRTGAAAGRDAG